MKAQCGDERLKQWHNLLQIFAFGTWNDVKANRNGYPAMSEEQQRKLKCLSVVSMCENRRQVPYSELMPALDMETIVELEAAHPWLYIHRVGERAAGSRIEGSSCREHHTS